MKRIPVPSIMLPPILVGLLSTVLFVYAWVAYCWGDGDGDRAVFSTALEMLGGPLLIGSVLALRGRRVGVQLLRFGAFLFICEPMTLFALWQLESDPQYIDWLARRGE